MVAGYIVTLIFTGVACWLISRAQMVRVAAAKVQRAAEKEIARHRDHLAELVEQRTNELRESEERFKDFAQSSSDWFWEMDDQFRFTNVFRGYRSSAEIDPSAYLGKMRQETTSEDTNNDKWRQHQDDLESHRSFRNFVFELKAPNGVRMTVLVNGKAVFDESGTFCGYRGTGSDITEQKSLEDQLRRSQRMDAVGQLTGGIAHDFNNLLGVMVGNAEILGSQIDEDEPSRRNVEAIIKAVDRGASLTQRLLAFSRQQTLAPRPTAINDLVLGLEDMLQRTLGETIALSTRLGPGVLDALIDPHQFENALINLAINARDAMPNGGALTIETENVTLDEAYAEQHEDVIPGEYLKVAVSDSGTGMSPEVLEKVFEPFFTTKGMGEGTGLGLSMVYGFIKQSKGHIAINSRLDHGTTVELYLPLARQPARRDDRAKELTEVAAGSERILVVEDNEELRKILTDILRDQGYRVVEVQDGKEAIKYLQEGQPFDLLFTDMVLPGGMNGADIAEQAKQIQPSIKALFTTGYAEHSVVDKAKLASSATLVSKPYRRTELLAKVRQVLDSVVG